MGAGALGDWQSAGLSPSAAKRSLRLCSVRLGAGGTLVKWASQCADVAPGYVVSKCIGCA